MIDCKTIEVEFSMKTPLSTNELKETVNITVEDYMSEDEIEETIQDYHNEWVKENIKSGWKIKSNQNREVPSYKSFTDPIPKRNDNQLNGSTSSKVKEFKKRNKLK